MFITIFTPTYNRAYILNRLFNSLVTQRIESFEWLIVDDGLTDDTYKLVGDFKRRASFKIIDVYQSNGDKHTAHNKALDFDNGELMEILDSDDDLFPYALKENEKEWRMIPVGDRVSLSGIICNCVNDRAFSG